MSEAKSIRSASADTTLDSHASTAASMDETAIVVRRKKPIAAWRLAVMFAWYVLSLHLIKEFRRLTIRSIGMGLFLSLLDATVVATMLVEISEEFQDFRTSSWVVLAYTLTEVGTSLTQSPTHASSHARVPITRQLLA